MGRHVTPGQKNGPAANSFTLMATVLSSTDAIEITDVLVSDPKIEIKLFSK